MMGFIAAAAAAAVAGEIEIDRQAKQALPPEKYQQWRERPREDARVRAEALRSERQQEPRGGWLPFVIGMVIGRNP